MAKKSQIERQKRRERLVTRYATRRGELLAAGDYEGLKKLPRDASPTRLKNRCAVTGRSRGYIRRFGVSRIVFRELAMRGQLPGVKKASW